MGVTYPLQTAMLKRISAACNDGNIKVKSADSKTLYITWKTYFFTQAFIQQVVRFSPGIKPLLRFVTKVVLAPKKYLYLICFLTDPDAPWTIWRSWYCNNSSQWILYLLICYFMFLCILCFIIPFYLCGILRMYAISLCESNKVLVYILCYFLLIQLRNEWEHFNQDSNSQRTFQFLWSSHPQP